MNLVTQVSVYKSSQKCILFQDRMCMKSVVEWALQFSGRTSSCMQKVLGLVLDGPMARFSIRQFHVFAVVFFSALHQKFGYCYTKLNTNYSVNKIMYVLSFPLPLSSVGPDFSNSLPPGSLIISSFRLSVPKHICFHISASN